MKPKNFIVLFMLDIFMASIDPISIKTCESLEKNNNICILFDADDTENPKAQLNNNYNAITLQSYQSTKMCKNKCKRDFSDFSFVSIFKEYYSLEKKIVLLQNTKSKFDKDSRIQQNNISKIQKNIKEKEIDINNIQYTINEDEMKLNNLTTLNERIHVSYAKSILDYRDSILYEIEILSGHKRENLIQKLSNMNLEEKAYNYLNIIMPDHKRHNIRQLIFSNNKKGLEKTSKLREISANKNELKQAFDNLSAIEKENETVQRKIDNFKNTQNHLLQLLAKGLKFSKRVTFNVSTVVIVMQCIIFVLYFLIKILIFWKEINDISTVKELGEMISENSKL